MIKERFTKKSSTILTVSFLGASVLLRFFQELQYDSFDVVSFVTFTGTAVLFGLYLLFPTGRITSSFFSVWLGIDVVCRLYSLITWIRFFVLYSAYIKTSPLSVVFSAVYLAIFIFLLIDSLKKHRHLKLARILVSGLLLLNVIGVFGNAFSYGLTDALVSGYYTLFLLALFGYYFLLAENSVGALEAALYRLKRAYENGAITAERYAEEKRKLLRKL